MEKEKEISSEIFEEYKKLSQNDIVKYSKIEHSNIEIS